MDSFDRDGSSSVFDLCYLLRVVQGKLAPEELMHGGRFEEFLSEHYSLVSQRENSKYMLDQHDCHSPLILSRRRISSRQKVGHSSATLTEMLSGFYSQQEGQ